MAEIVADCPRCKAQKITFDLAGDARVPGEYESFSICRACRKSTVFQFTPKDSMGARTRVRPKRRKGGRRRDEPRDARLHVY